MTVWSLVRRVERVVGRGLKGGRILLGPYNLKRELPVLLTGLGIAVLVALAGFPLAGIWGLVIAGFLAAFVMAATVLRIVWRRGDPTWPPRHVRIRARINERRRHPVWVSGRGQTSPASVTVGGRVRVHQ